jgi:EmrB/QacA subfamily drug resistance transporter
MQSYFHATSVQLQWMINIYLLALPLFVVIAGKMGDILGHRKIISFGIALFAFSSFFCGLSQSSSQFIIARFFQGLGAAMIVPTSTAILFENISEKNRGTVMGMISFSNSFFIAMGPLFGGFITSYFSWHYIFFINVPFSCVALFFTLIFLAKSPIIKETIDILGFFSYGLCIVCLTIGIMQGKDWGWNSIPILTLFFFFFLFFIILWYADKRAKHPFISFYLFNISSFRCSILVIFFVSFARAMIIFWPIYFQDVLSLSPFASGALTSASGFLNMVVAPSIGKIIDRLGDKKPVIMGLALLILSFLWITVSMFLMNLYLVLPGLLMIGVGLILVMIPSYISAMNSVPSFKRGIAAGLISTFRETGGTLGVAVLGSIILNLHFMRFSSILSQNSDTALLNPSLFEGFFSKTASTLEALKHLPLAVQQEVIDGFRLSYSFAISLTNTISALIVTIGLLIALIFFKYKKKEEKQYSLEP